MEKRKNFMAFVEIWNKEQELQTPTHHKQICKWLESAWGGKKRELLLMAFRNSGKSTLVGLFCAWVLYENPNVRIMVLAADLALARKMTRNVKRIIERHPMCAGLKPKRVDQWASDQFTVNRTLELRDPSMLAKGISANVTGSRADVVICDDVEVPNTCDSAPKRDDLRERLSEIEYVMVPGGLQLYVGTPHTVHTIYAKEKIGDSEDNPPFLAGFNRLEIPLLGKGGKPVWPERFDVKKIASIKRRTGPNKFRAQMLLEPVDIRDGRLDSSLLKPYSGEIKYSEMNGHAVLSINGQKMVSASCWWDPSFGSPNRGDGAVIAAVFTCEHGEYWLHDIKYLTHDEKIINQVSEAQQLCNGAADFVNQLHLPSVLLESNGIGKFLPTMLRNTFAEMGVTAAVVEHHTKTNKDIRILDAFDAPLAAGRINAHERVLKSRFRGEMDDWRPGSNNKDDALDAVAGCLLAEPVRIARVFSGVNRPPDWRAKPGGYNAKTSFDV
ncbi:MAG: phage terminase large subunit [Rhodospirillaceae bacterium]|nr:phage terminase large subunit [Rhodospirillaceae bacterium]